MVLLVVRKFSIKYISQSAQSMNTYMSPYDNIQVKKHVLMPKYCISKRSR